MKDMHSPRAWSRFWLTPVDPVGLHAVRVLAGLLFLAWLLPLAGQASSFFSLSGWFDTRAFVETSRLPNGSPAPVGWSLLYLCGDDPVHVQAAYWTSIGVLVLFTFGVWPRVTAVLTWLIVVSYTFSPVTSIDADYLLIVLAFYLMLGYLFLGQWSQQLTPRERILGGKPSRQPSHAAGVALRLIQVHFAIVVVTSGLHKLQFGDWWSGVAYWYPLNPPFEVTRDSLRGRAASAATYLGWLSLIQYVALAWQLTFPLFAWRRSWRVLLLAGGVCGWIGSVAICRQPLLGPLLLVVCLSYLSAEEWRRLLRSDARAVRPGVRVAKGELAHV